jgi:hypothetical protein
MPQIQFGVQAYQHESLPLSSQNMRNCYLEPAPPAAKTAAAVVCAFGVKTHVTVGAGPLRGVLFVNQTAYVVSGTDLYSIKNGVVSTSLGSVPGSGRVIMASDGSHVVIAVNGPTYVYDGATVTQITDENFPGYVWMTYLDGYFIGGPGDGKFYINHTAFDPTGWNALDFATTESGPDDIVGSVVDHREAFFGGRQKFEVWYNSGDADFPLSRTASGYMEIGLVSKFGITKADNSVFFAASDGTLRRVNGYTPARISTTAIEQAIAKYASQDCIAFSWIENGHTMVAFSYVESTFVYDVSTQLWHERQSYGRKNWVVGHVARGENVTLAADSRSNRIGILSADVFTEWDQPMVSSVVSPTTPDVPHSSLELEFESGVGTTGQGADPQVMLQFSEDGGRTWSNEIRRPLGQRGDFKRKSLFNRLGKPRLGNRVYRASISDPVRRTLIQALLNGP